MGQLLQVGVLRPHGLRDHLGQLHGSQGGAEPAVAGEDVDAGLDQPDGLGGGRIGLVPQVQLEEAPAGSPAGQDSCPTPLPPPVLPHRSAPCSESPRCLTGALRLTASVTGVLAKGGWF